MRRATATMGAMLLAMAMSGTARSADGRIEFRGMIVTPTCAPATNATIESRNAGPNEANASVARCVGHADHGAPRYRLRVEPAADAIGDDSMVRYFVGYVRDLGIDASPRMVTQTYD